ncbi:aldehyde oxidase and xanthine dehydrogenase molybdopterin binding [Ahrensia sp. R2A130]|nr:aldehyde oxidase and xanthine dehydrogenase molybdopterin binding [Ahrensia sp. R2A130]
MDVIHIAQFRPRPKHILFGHLPAEATAFGPYFTSAIRLRTGSAQGPLSASFAWCFATNFSDR